MKYEIYQIKDTEKTDYAFMRYAFAQRNNFSLNDYEKVYEGNIELEDESRANEVKPENYLEHLFYIFNCKYPQDFKGRSMSVSDVVILDGITYYCDSCGFTKI